MGPGLQTQTQGLNWERAGQKPAADQTHSEITVSLDFIWFIKEQKKLFFFLKLRVSLASQPLVIKVERIPI